MGRISPACTREDERTGSGSLSAALSLPTDYAAGAASATDWNSKKVLANEKQLCYDSFAALENTAFGTR